MHPYPGPGMILFGVCRVSVHTCAREGTPAPKTHPRMQERSTHLDEDETTKSTGGGGGGGNSRRCSFNAGEIFPTERKAECVTHERGRGADGREGRGRRAMNAFAAPLLMSAKT